MRFSRPLPLGGLFLLCLAVTACDPAALLGPRAANARQDQLRVSYHRGPCYGRCEVYSLDVYDTGLLLFRGERFTERPGLWETNIDRRRVNALLDSFERAGFAAFPRNFPSRIPDAPAVEFRYRAADGAVYETTFKEAANPMLEALDQSIRRLAALPDYRPVAAEVSVPGLQAATGQGPQEIIVHLREGIDIRGWLVRYGPQNLRLKEQLGGTGAYFLLTADPNIMGADEVLDLVRRDEAVLSAQLNQPVRGRE